MSRMASCSDTNGVSRLREERRRQLAKAHLNVDLSGGDRQVLKMTLPEVKSVWSEVEKVVLDWTCKRMTQMDKTIAVSVLVKMDAFGS